MEFVEDLPAVVGDRVQLQQVIMNLLINAKDAMAAIDDRTRKTVVATDHDESGFVRLRVCDAGIGLRTEDADTLFYAFYTTKEGGMGIGLSVSRSIIEAHGGHLSATRNAGPGATFAFSIPHEDDTSEASQTNHAECHVTVKTTW